MAKARLARLVERYHYHHESKFVLARILITASSIDLPCLGATPHTFELRRGVEQVERSAEHHVGRGKAGETSIDHDVNGPLCMNIGNTEMD